MTTNVVRSAELFATFHHGIIGQKRKYTGMDYIHHPQAVVNILKQYGIIDPYTLAVGWLHDTVEDTNATSEDVYRFFSFHIASSVFDLTDSFNGNRAQRKAEDRVRIAHGQDRSKLVKAADCLDNLSDIVDNDPKFAKVYVAEIKQLRDEAFPKGDNIHPIFEALDGQINEAMKELGLGR